MRKVFNGRPLPRCFIFSLNVSMNNLSHCKKYLISVNVGSTRRANRRAAAVLPHDTSLIFIVVFLQQHLRYDIVTVHQLCLIKL